ncbi:hypothetical protein LEL_06961 [Akanthomyces lecanii RCEF 1005]|uniref:Uncharacterized protein n=1 Tax=Akanthomyces lecanii RCEF 1005 TaxID=1081108 RepID=A0A168FCC6_CORDF|nr:hypothetical protein LEL_06961 [Akanthomyces lecanii RCEF 1005]
MPTVAALRIHFSHVQYVVLVCVLLQAFRIVITDQTQKLSQGNEAWTQPHMTNLTDTLQLSSSTLTNASYTGTWNITHLVTTEKPKSLVPPPTAFFSFVTARALLYAAVASLVGYYWNFLLERQLPARPRGDSSSYNNDKLAEGHEQLEEKICREVARQRQDQKSFSEFLEYRSKVVVGHFGRASTCSFGYRTDQDCRVFETASQGVAKLTIMPANQRVIFASAFYFVCTVFFQVIIYIVVPRFVMSRIGTQWLESLTETTWLVARHQHADQVLSYSTQRATFEAEDMSSRFAHTTANPQGSGHPDGPIPDTDFAIEERQDLSGTKEDARAEQGVDQHDPYAASLTSNNLVKIMEEIRDGQETIKEVIMEKMDPYRDISGLAKEIWTKFWYAPEDDIEFGLPRHSLSGKRFFQELMPFPIYQEADHNENAGYESGSENGVVGVWQLFEDPGLRTSMDYADDLRAVLRDWIAESARHVSPWADCLLTDGTLKSKILGQEKLWDDKWPTASNEFVRFVYPGVEVDDPFHYDPRCIENYAKKNRY